MVFTTRSRATLSTPRICTGRRVTRTMKGTACGVRCAAFCAGANWSSKIASSSGILATGSLFRDGCNAGKDFLKREIRQRTMKIFRDLLGIPPPPTPKEIDQGLREIFDFIDSDLKANRDGHMSAKQRYWLVDKFLRKILPPIMITVVYSWFLFASSHVAPVPSSDPSNTSTFPFLIWLILVIWAVTAF